MGAWDAIRAIPQAVRPDDVIRMRDGVGIKQALVVGVRSNYFIVRKKRSGKGWSTSLKRAYFPNVVAPLIIEPAEPEPAAEPPTMVCPRDGGTMVPATSYKPPINYAGWICMNCGHKHDEEPTTKRTLHADETLLPTDDGEV